MDVSTTNFPQPYLSGNAPFPQKYLDTLYPKSQWAERKEFGLHFLLAGGMPDGALIGAYVQKNSRAILVCDPQHDNLCPLHVAAMKANRAAAERLIQEDHKCLSKKTSSGFSPLHIAALTSAELYDLFIAGGADPDLKTNTGMRAKDLRLLCGRAVDIRSVDSLFYQESEGHAPVLIYSNSQLVTRVFGENFWHCDTPLIEAPFFPELHEQKKGASHPLFFEAYHDYLRRRPKLVIGPSPLLQQLELRAHEKIEAGCVLTEYTGKKCEIPFFKKFADNFSEQEMEDSAYRGFNALDARHAGNESRFLNCGFPNVSIETVEIDGVERNLVISLEEIEPGMPILLDYGMDMLYLIFGIQRLLGKERLKLFYKKHGKNLLLKLDEAQSRYDRQKLAGALTLKDVAALSAVQCWIAFPIQNPTALLYLHFSKAVDYIKFCKDIGKTSSEFLQGLTSRLNYQHIENIIEILKRIKKTCQKGEWDKVAAWVLERLEKIPLTHIIKGLDLFAKGKKAKEIDQTLTQYDWLADEDHPLSYKRRVDHLVFIYSKIPKEEIIPSLELTLNEQDREFESYRMTKEIIKRLRSGKQ